MLSHDNKFNGKRTSSDWDIKIIAHAWKDKNFLKKLVANPKQTLKEFGCPCPENFRVNIIEEKENEYTLVIPQAPSETSKLEESQLAQMAGGSLDTWHAAGSQAGCCRQ